MLNILIPALAAIIAATATVLLTKHKEREAIWRAKKLAYYEEFFAATSGIVGSSVPPEAQIRFATAVNNLHLIGSPGVINALHRFCDETAASNSNKSVERHDTLWSRLVWEIRSDLNDPPSERPEDFRAWLWDSGVPSHQQSAPR